MKYNELIAISIKAAELASKEILEVYWSDDFRVESKQDRSPLTRADKQAHVIIASVLKETGLPVLSEEGKTIRYVERKQWEYFWMVDPLDGTREFLNHNGEFTVNIALIHVHRPVLGVVSVPVAGDLYYATEGNGAFVKRNGTSVQLNRKKPVDLGTPGLRVVASRSHMNEETWSFISSLNKPVLVSAGSSLKFMLLAEGKADVYPRFAPTMEWDTAAAHAIVKEAGITVTQRNSSQELVYNKSDLLNPEFLCY